MLALMSAGQQAFMGIPNLDEVEALELLEDDKRNIALRAIRNDEISLNARRWTEGEKPVG